MQSSGTLYWQISEFIANCCYVCQTLNLGLLVLSPGLAHLRTICFPLYKCTLCYYNNNNNIIIYLTDSSPLTMPLMNNGLHCAGITCWVCAWINTDCRCCSTERVMTTRRLIQQQQRQQDRAMCLNVWRYSQNKITTPLLIASLTGFRLHNLRHRCRTIVITGPPSNEPHDDLHPACPSVRRVP